LQAQAANEKDLLLSEMVLSTLICLAETELWEAGIQANSFWRDAEALRDASAER
jgi:hypothetical protein